MATLIFSLHGNTLSLRNQYCFKILLISYWVILVKWVFFRHSRDGDILVEKIGVGLKSGGSYSAQRHWRWSRWGAKYDLCTNREPFGDTAKIAGENKMDRRLLWFLSFSKCSRPVVLSKSREVGKMPSKSSRTGWLNIWFGSTGRFWIFGINNSLSSEKWKPFVSVFGGKRENCAARNRKESGLCAIRVLTGLWGLKFSGSRLY